MNIDMICLLKAIGYYMIVMAIMVATLLAIWAAAKLVVWVITEVFSVGKDDVDTIGGVALVLFVVAIFVIMPVYRIYNGICQ